MNHDKITGTWRQALLGLAVMALFQNMTSTAAAEAILVHRYGFDNNMSDLQGSIDGSFPTTSGQIPVYDNDAADKVAGDASIYFDGADDYAIIPKSAGSEILLDDGGYSLTFWTKLQRDNVQGYFMCDATTTTNLYLQMSPVGYFDGSTSTKVGTNWRFRDPNGDPWATGVWYHHAIVVPEIASGETGTATWYVDGVARETMELHAFGGLVGDLSLGNRASDLLRDYQGWLDDLQVYDGALTAGDVAYLYAHPGELVPEPGTACLLAVGLLGLLGWRRRRTG